MQHVLFCALFTVIAARHPFERNGHSWLVPYSGVIPLTLPHIRTSSFHFGFHPASDLVCVFLANWTATCSFGCPFVLFQSGGRVASPRCLPLTILSPPLLRFVALRPGRIGKGWRHASVLDTSRLVLGLIKRATVRNQFGGSTVMLGVPRGRGRRWFPCRSTFQIHSEGHPGHVSRCGRDLAPDRNGSTRMDPIQSASGYGCDPVPSPRSVRETQDQTDGRHLAASRS